METPITLTLVIDDPDHPMKLLAGARMFDLSTDVKWNLEGDIAGQPIPGRNGKAVADWVTDKAAARTGAEYELVDLRDYPLPRYKDFSLRWNGRRGTAHSYALIAGPSSRTAEPSPSELSKTTEPWSASTSWSRRI